MELSKVIAELRAERTAIDEALAALERIARSSTGKRRGRPPLWLKAETTADAEAGATPGEPRKKRSMSPEVKKKMAEAQKKRWAAYRKEHGAEEA